jgi:hypothetical protein
MNQSMLIVICDFLTLSMLALARFDKAPPEPVQAPSVANQTMQVTAAPDVMESLKDSLRSEELARIEMLAELERRAGELQTQVERSESLEQEKSRLEGEQERLERLRSQLEQERDNLTYQVSRTQQERDRLREEMAAAQERQRMIQEQLAKREQDLERSRGEISQLQQEKHETERDNAILATRLESAQAAQQRLEGEISTLRTEREAAHEQASQLAKNVGELAQAQVSATETISEEIRAATPVSLNTIYDNFRKSRAILRFNTRETLLIGEGEAIYELYTVFVRDGQGGVVALCEAARTPLEADNLDDLRSVQAMMTMGGGIRRAVDGATFLKADPRVLAFPLSAEDAQAPNVRPFELETDPFRYANAVILTADGERYGEVPFRLSPGTTRYIDVQSSIANRLFGSFAPVEGDLVFSQKGNLMGFMVSSTRAVLLSNLDTVDQVALGNAFDAKAATETSERLQKIIPSDPLQQQQRQLAPRR